MVFWERANFLEVSQTGDFKAQSGLQKRGKQNRNPDRKIAPKKIRKSFDKKIRESL